MALIDDDIKIADILCEFFEVVIHNVLYIRNLYPSEIFKKTKKYGVVVYQAVHPYVNEYIVECLKGIHFHLKLNQLKSLYICITSSQDILERYIFDIISSKTNEMQDLYINLEQNLRDFCLKLHTSKIYLNLLPKEASFNIQLCTTEYNLLQYNEDSSRNDFPWIHVNTNSSSHAEVVPVHTIDTDELKLQAYIEKFRDKK